MKTRTFLVSTALALRLASVLVLGATVTIGAEAKRSLMPLLDGQTQLLLRVSEDGSKLEDAAHGAAVKSYGTRIVADDTFGHAVECAADEEHWISVEDGGRFRFEKGFTIEAWLNASSPADGTSAWGSVAAKDGSFAFQLNKTLALDNQRMVFPRYPMVTTDKRQLNYSPVNDEAFGGATSIPTGQWAHLAVTYDADRRVIRTWIDGSEDRVRYLTRTGDDARMQVDPAAPLLLFKGRNKVLVGPVRVSGVARAIGPARPLEVYVHQLPYQKRVVLQYTHLGSDLPYPLQTSVTWEYPTGAAMVAYRGTLTGPEDKFVELERKGWNNDYFNIHVRVSAGHKEVYSRMTRVTNGSVAADKRIIIRPDRRISVNGKTIFPFVMYHAYPEDFQQIADMGFHYITPRAPGSPFLDFGRKSAAEHAHMKSALDAAQKAGIQLIIPARISVLGPVFLFKDHPALGAWAAYDEPWGVSLDKMIDSYNAIKMINAEVPILCPQNNLSRMSETAEGLDFLACDPYPIPLVSLRMVADATIAARRAVANLKPVWTLLDQYDSPGDDKRPALTELRCMLYLSIAAGADGIGIYAWDYRRETPEGQKLWCTKNSPADLEILRTAMKELVAIENVLLIPNDEKCVTFTRHNRAIHVAFKQSGKQKFLIIANDSRGPEQATVRIEGIGNATATNLADGTKLSVTNGSIALNMAPMAAGAYRIE